MDKTPYHKNLNCPQVVHRLKTKASQQFFGEIWPANSKIYM